MLRGVREIATPRICENEFRAALAVAVGREGKGRAGPGTGAVAEGAYRFAGRHVFGARAVRMPHGATRGIRFGLQTRLHPAAHLFESGAQYRTVPLRSKFDTQAGCGLSL